MLFGILCLSVTSLSRLSRHPTPIMAHDTTSSTISIIQYHTIPCAKPKSKVHAPSTIIIQFSIGIGIGIDIDIDIGIGISLSISISLSIGIFNIWRLGPIVITTAGPCPELAATVPSKIIVAANLIRIVDHHRQLHWGIEKGRNTHHEP
jgi:hypothetical protein